MHTHEADELKLHLDRLRQVAWDLECACPKRREVYALVDRLDELESWLEEHHDPAKDECDL